MEHTKKTGKIPVYIISVLLIAAILFYLRELYLNGLLNYSSSYLFGKSTVSTVGLAVLLILTAALVFFWSKRDSEIYFVFISFVLLFLIYSLRAPGDLFHPYLWAEDGVNLLNDSIYGKSIFDITPQGTMWVLQRIIAYISTDIGVFFGNYLIIPYLMCIISKITETLGVFYFVSDSFSFLIKERHRRFLVCVGIILLAPQAYDLVTCDCSLPFALIFTVFLIGLKYLFSPDIKLIPTWYDTVFLSFFAISSAAAPFAIVVVGLGFLRLLYDMYKNKKIDKKIIAIVTIRCIIIFIFVMIQIFTILNSGRETGSLDLLNRMTENTKNFIFLPYISNVLSRGIFAIGFFVWAALLYLHRIPWKLVLYFMLSSWIFLLYSSFVSDTEVFYTEDISTGPRYIWFVTELCIFFIGIQTDSLLKENNERRAVGIFLTIASLIIAIPTYYIKTINEDLAKNYEMNSSMIDKNGSDLVIINIGPWEPYFVALPSDFSGGVSDNFLDIRITGVFSDDGIEKTVSKENIENSYKLECTANTKSGNNVKLLFLLEEDKKYRGADIKSGNTFSFSYPKGTIFTKNNSITFAGITDDGKIHKERILLK